MSKLGMSINRIRPTCSAHAMHQYLTSRSINAISVCFHPYSKLSSLGLLASFKKKGDTDLHYRFDEDVKTAEQQKQRQTINSIFQSMDKKYRGNADIDLVKDEDEIQALKRTWMSEIGQYSETIQTLKYQFIEKEIKEVQSEMLQQGRDFIPKNAVLNLLSAGRDHPTPRVKSLSEELQKKCWKIMETDMSRKYTPRTPLKHIKEDEKRMLRTLRPDASTAGMIVKFYWDVMAQDLDYHMGRYAQNPREYPIKDGYVRKMKFFISGPGVPSSVRDKAKRFITELQNDGKIPPPQGRGGRGYRRY